jgi:hypothetical protein
MLARALVERGRHDEAQCVLDEADETFARFGSAAHCATAWR